MNYQKVDFKRSAVKPSDFIRDGRVQIVFSGKSNVGKSSVINRVLNRKNFARVGGTPGKTVHINYFLVDETAYFVDLPGYGYAAVSKAERDRWGKLMEQYFAESGLISAGVMIVDGRHKPTADDVTMAQWFQSTGCPLIVCANKCDKVKKSELEGNLQLIRQTLSLDESTIVLAFSAEKGTGCSNLISWIEGIASGKSNG
ncbi:MAG: ribosome biogenesis GTP-binding protein YihA/YsxC [Oscillospiraceae bacterium]|nr:ribosome biogenesis GTP-binding protein YihA/YsxC [Oscillospiraceae bacterium]